MNDWLDNTILFGEWLAAWRAAWRLGARQPTIAIDYNGIPSLPWQVYLVDPDETLRYKGKRIKGAGPAKESRRRLTDVEAVEFLRTACQFISPDPTDRTQQGRWNERRARLLQELSISIAEDLWDLYIQDAQRRARKSTTL